MEKYVDSWPTKSQCLSFHIHSVFLQGLWGVCLAVCQVILHLCNLCLNRINELTLELGFDCKHDGDHDDVLECHLACTANTKHLHGHELCQGLSTSDFFRNDTGSEMQIYVWVIHHVTLCPSERRPSPEQARSWRASESGPARLSQLASNAITEKKKRHRRNRFC